VTTPPATADRPSPPRRGVGKVLLLVFGSVLALVALALLAGGVTVVWANETQRDDDGYVSTRTERFSTSTYALTYDGGEIGDVGDAPDWLVDRLGTVQLRATSATRKPVFVGIGSQTDVAAYLDGVAHGEITDIDLDPFETTVRATAGGRSPAPPGERRIWAAAASGTGRQVARWDIEGGDWSAVVMNADGSRNVAADIELAAKAGWIRWVGVGVAAAGLLIGLGSAAMIVAGARRPRGSG
jgi:hypothetical protein